MQRLTALEPRDYPVVFCNNKKRIRLNTLFLILKMLRKTYAFFNYLNNCYRYPTSFYRDIRSQLQERKA